ncbi:MAG TPA: exopolysaccharide biosynthesis polyprenyl glycosylphosphotransferase [Chthoniobacterales bacterium]|jgi:putative colanic acid biosynthesis UDP-glucose lipid carrier transferase|nr:exopolysaccharide biosynthesis polyprenyl glycosylphosphotransferase [Chthoniobacterales bacterium]
MLTQRTEGLYRLFLLCQILIVAAAFWLGVWIMVTFYSEGGALTWGRYSIYCGMLVLGVTLETLSRSKNSFLQNELLRPHRLSLRQTAAGVGLLVLYLVAAKDAFISRVFLFNFVPWLYIALLFSHYYLPSVLARGIFRREDKTILIGSSRRAAQLRDWLQRKAEIGFRTVGLISDDEKIDNVDVPLLGKRDQLEQIIRDHGITQVILLEFPLVTEGNQDVIQLCDQLGIRLLILSDLEERLRHSVTHFEDGGFRFIGLREEPLENPLNRFLKRLIDIGIALPVMLLVFPPLALVVWIAQRLQSSGPLFHVQNRAGMQNRQFKIYKFRTMHSGNGEVSRQASQSDERVYPLGKWFRKLSLDEVPQFWNVLLGDMSIVGPRPHLIEHNQQFSKFLANYHVRAFVKPGITGLAQVRGFRGEARDNSDIRNRVACDIEYLENWNLSLEIAIILRTFAQIIRPPRTAY